MSEPITKTTIISEILDKSFFAGVRNTINDNRFLLLKRLSNLNPISDICGKFEISNNYYNALKILHLSSQEVRYEKLFLLKKILPALKSFDHLLDIGCADCSVTKIAGRKFKQITLVDKDKEITNKISVKWFPNCLKLSVFNQPIEEINFKDCKYDLIILSHVLYYIPRSKWFSLATKLFNLLNKNGTLFITITGGLDKQKLISAFSKNSLTTENLINNIFSFITKNVKVYHSHEALMSKDIETMLHIANIYLADANATATLNDVKHYLLKNHLLLSGNFKLNIEQQFIVITKDK